MTAQVRHIVLPIREILIGLLWLLVCAAVLGLGSLLFEYGYRAEPHPSNGFMAASRRWLELNQFKTQETESLALAVHHGLQPGMIVIADQVGLMQQAEVASLQKWTRAGNTLIIHARAHRENAAAVANRASFARFDNLRFAPFEDDFELARIDRLGSKWENKSRASTVTLNPCMALDIPLIEMPKVVNAERCSTAISLQGRTYQLLRSRYILQSTADDEDSIDPVSTDFHADVIRIYRYGKGNVVFLSDTLFDDEKLRWFDHAELLTALASLSPGRTVTFVKHLEILSWRSLLWQNLPFVVVSLPVLLLLMLWAAVPRFGPLLPTPTTHRRSLLEHIDAAGRWYFASPAGREKLLRAIRTRTLRSVTRRRPEFARMSEREKIGLLKDDTQIGGNLLQSALFDDAASAPHTFTLQLQTLQKLRNHYERKS